jgi:2-hydroxychromene-2-carboxylate isomerase
MPEELAFELYWSFRSPYSYLLLPRVRELVERYRVRAEVRIVRPLAVRTPELFTEGNPLWAPYVIRDATRTAEYLGLPFRWPARPDPVVMEAGRFAEQQPHITRLSRLGSAAVEAGRGLEFIGEVSWTLFSGEVDGWDRGEHLAHAAARAGLDLRTLEQSAAAQEQRLDQVIEENERAQTQAGHWGVPLMVFQGEPFFGQDRLDMLIWRLRQHGLQRR